MFTTSEILFQQSVRFQTTLNGRKHCFLYINVIQKYITKYNVYTNKYF